eukprot:7381909-Prymnesium_polylepis.1
MVENELPSIRKVFDLLCPPSFPFRVQALLSICGVFNEALKISQGGGEEVLFVGGLSVVVVWG